MFNRRKIKLTDSEIKTMAVALYQYKHKIEDAIKAVNGNKEIDDWSTICNVLREEEREIKTILHKLRQLRWGEQND